MIHAPYKSGSAAATDLLGGQVQMMFEQMYVAVPGVQSGKTRAIAVTSKTRSPILPNVPTMAESGFPPPLKCSTGGHLWAPKGCRPTS